jgi:hypothetical protein
MVASGSGCHFLCSPLSLIHSPTHSFTDSFTHPLTHSFTHLLIHSFPRAVSLTTTAATHHPNPPPPTTHHHQPLTTSPQIPAVVQSAACLWQFSYLCSNTIDSVFACAACAKHNLPALRYPLSLSLSLPTHHLSPPSPSHPPPPPPFSPSHHRPPSHPPLLGTPVALMSSLTRLRRCVAPPSL